VNIKKLLVLDTSYSLEMIFQRKLEFSVTCRDLDNFFAHVWTVHPFASLVTSSGWSYKYGFPKVYKLNSSHTFIEGKVGIFNFLRFFKVLNFIFSQIHIFFYLVRLIHKEKITIIRTGSPLYLGLFGWALSRWCKIPFVIRIGGNHDKIYSINHKPIEKIFFHRKIEKIIEHFTFRRADLVAGANQDNLNFALNNGARLKYSTLFRYGNLIDKRHFLSPSDRKGGRDFLKKFGIESQKYILYIGRLEIVKHPDHVIKVLADIRQRGFDLKAVFVGDGKLKSSLLELASNLRVADHALFIGNIDQDYLSKIIPLATVIISPHTGRALSEAALGGVPIIAYDVDWQGELIQTGVTGELVPYLNYKNIVSSLEKFLNDPLYASTMGNAVRKHTLELMDPATLNQHEREQYSATLNRFNKSN
jgi:glycosyltransferase involved in cell wall biosynthesis